MSILVYKQRHQHPNKKSTPAANYAHIRYIATRPRVMKNEQLSHGLFGKLKPGAVEEFATWEEAAKLVYANSRQGIILYRSVVSFTEETAEELLLKEQKSWQRYIENHIMTIAEKNGIKRENLQWVAAVHGERKHPHIHVAFWDTSGEIRNPYTSPQIPNAIRKQMIKDTFADKILTFAKEKDLAVRQMRRISDQLVEQFERELRLKNPGKYKAAERFLKEETRQEFFARQPLLTKLADKLFLLRKSIPETGRIAYQLLPPQSKEKTDELVEFLLVNVPQIKDCFDRYVKAKCRIASLYTAEESWLAKQKEQYEKEARKILANRVLSGVKAICRIEKEERSEAYLRHHRDELISRMLFEMLDMLAGMVENEEKNFLKHRLLAGELSKEAKKELFLKHQDKGYEH